MSNPDPRKRACDELAELLSTPEGLRTARLLELTGTVDVVPAAGNSGERKAETTGPRPISIWQPRRRDGELVFERPEPLPLGDHYARRRTLEAAKAPGVVRIGFFGESVAAGYLYAPHLTPAEVLERRLGAAEDAYEVIDLARTNETLDPMVTTLEASLQLDPDLLVIFAGNNWNLLETPNVSPYVPSVRSRQRYAQALRRAGLDGPPALARRDLAAKLERAFAGIAELVGRTPVIAVIPEVNLADWEDRQPITWLPGDGSARWHESYGSAIEHLEAGRHQAALATADAMRQLDGGRCPTTHRLRARALAALGRPQEMRRACEAEVESGAYATQCFLGAPRASVAEQKILRQEATRHGFNLVDLPRLFAGHTGSALPGRRLFLDYCHLSAEGIEVAMAAVGGEISKLRGGDPSRVAAAAGPGVEPAAAALAKLGAAIHGAHRLLTVGDKRPHVERWCREALAADPGVADAMRDVALARCAPCPAVLTAAQHRNLSSPHRVLLQHGWRWHHLDVEVVQAICSVLEEAGRPIRDEVDALLLQHHGVGSKAVDLSRPPYLWEPLERFYPEAMAPRAMTGRATLRSPWPQTSLCLIAGAERDVTLDLTARLPAIEGAPEARSGEVAIRINGREVRSMPTGESWTRRSLRISCEDLHRGINRVTLVWPTLPACGDAAFENAVRRLESGVEADLHPIFGEVFSLFATTAA